MTELFIAGVSVVLPSDLSFTLTEENPEITNNGEYSLDIDLSLLNATNAKTFKHLNRLNINSIESTMSAKLVVDNKVSLGKIIILSHTDISVKIQFLAGNSELNYNIKADNRKIWELDFGTESAIDFNRAYATLERSGYGHVYLNDIFVENNNFVCTPIMSAESILNDYYFTQQNVTSSINGVSNIVMQPYLLYYINKLPELLGFTLKSNILNDDNRAKKIYIVNSKSSLKYTDALPDMTISQFVNEIEFFFNVTFFVDKINREISIRSLKSILAEKPIITIDKVLDDYVRDLSQESQLTKFGFTKISYNIPDSLFFKYQNLSEEVLAKCEILTFNTYDSLYTYILTHNNEDQFKIFKTGNEQYIFGKDLTLNIFTRKIGNTEDNKHINLVNKFEDYIEDSESPLTLKICPAEIVSRLIPARFTENSITYLDNFQYQLPKSSLSKSDVVVQGITDVIEDGVKEIQRTSNIEVSLFTGILEVDDYPINSDGQKVYYPFSHVDKYPEYGPVSTKYGSPINYGAFETWMFAYFIPAATTNMRITGTNGIYADYHFQQIVDATKEYNFTLIEQPKIKSDNLFIINNKKYMPISLEHEVTIDGFGKQVTGKFYEFL